MNSYCYIFLLRKKNVSVYRYRNAQWEAVRRDGLDSFPFQNTRELIDWWKEEAAYSDGKVDLLFLSDDQENDWDRKLVQETFQFVNEQSIWSFSRLRDFFKQFVEMERVDLIASDNNTPYHVKDVTERPAPGSSFKFYAFPQLEEVQSIDQPSLEVKPSEETEPIPQKSTPSIGRGDGTGDILFRYFKANLENYDR